MPELPEVETVVRTLRPQLVGSVVRGVTLHRHDFAKPHGFDWQCIVGREVVAVSRRAKRIIVTIDDGNRFIAHLGMTGRLTFCDASDDMAKHTHVVFNFGVGELRFCDPRRFGNLTWMGRDCCESGVGPEPLTLKAAHLADRLLTTRRPVKSALLDQTFIAGLGNIYADEALFAAGIHPLTPCNAIDRPAAAGLCRSIKRILRRAINAGGSTLRDYVDANGKAGRAQQLHKVYARNDQPCRKCHTVISKLVLGGRSTHFCEHCQQAA